MTIETQEIIEYLRDVGFVGVISNTPNIEELMVSFDSAVVEVNFNFKTDYTESQLKKILEGYNIRRRTPEQFYEERTGEKLKKRRKRSNAL